MKALAFCVSQEHASYMARIFRDAHLGAEHLDATSSADHRRVTMERVRRGELQVICSVDLLHEGLDVPGVDTVLLLRPTESATVFLQQLGRGLRHAPGKACLTVLDFIGQQRKEFRFDRRLSALNGIPPEPADRRLAAMFVFNVWNDGGGYATIDDALVTLWRSSAFRAEALELLAIVADRIEHVPIALPDHFGVRPLWVHATYSREELLAGLGYATMTRTPRGDQTGVRYVENLQADVFTSTINKTPGRYSPTTMYRDYPLSEDRFHWESQNATAVDSLVGQRYIHHAAGGGWVLLFARLEEQDEVGTAPFLFLGPATYESHRGSKPIAIVWRLHHRLPPRLVRRRRRPRRMSRRHTCPASRPRVTPD